MIAAAVSALLLLAALIFGLSQGIDRRSQVTGLSETDASGSKESTETTGSQVSLSSSAAEAPTLSPSATPIPTPSPEPAETSTKPTTGASSGQTTKKSDGSPDLSGYVVVIDPGHQKHANSDQEPIAPDYMNIPGTKDKCSAGTSGVSTGRAEYAVNLEIGLMLRDYLQSLGCEVYMTRETNDVDLSNIDRAEYAVSKSPDVYLRLHCDGSDSSSSRGIGVFVTDQGSLASSLPDWGELLGECVSAYTGARFRGCVAGTTYSGLNWAAQIPSFLLEMGFMTNPDEDELLSEPGYQQKICGGIADFVSQMPKK